MNSVASEFDPFDEIAESFVERYRRGERPSLEEYIDRYPELSQRIRALFPALALVEQVGSLGGGPALGPREMAPGRGEHPVVLGEYRILREVGRGGMGIVYEAVQESLGRHVALKVLPFNAALTPTHLERFRREAQSAANLHHTNIVPVFGVGEDAGLHYYAMQFIQGQSLDTVLQELRQFRRSRGLNPPNHEPPKASDLTRSVARGLLTAQFAGPGPPAAVGSVTAVPGAQSTGLQPEADNRAPSSGGSGSGLVVAGDNAELTAQSETQYFRSVARVGVQVAEALAYAHQQGIIHRDIKPANLLLDAHGTVWVTDFGLAKAVDANELTGPGDIVGTLRYMAPERFLGVTDVRGDVYGLGASLYELVTLQPPFDDTDRLSLIKRVSHEEPAAPRKLDRRIPHDLETIILKAMDKDPQRRFQSAAEMADELRLFLADRPIRARRSSLLEHSWRWCRRNRQLAGLIATLLLLVLLGGVGLPVALLLRAERDRALAAEDEARNLLVRAQNAETEARTAERENEIRAHLAQAAAYRHSRQPGQRFQCLAEIAKAMALQPGPKFMHELRNEAIAALALPDIHITQEFEAFPPGTFCVEFSDDFELYARATNEGDCIVYRAADNTVLAQFPTLGERTRLEFGAGKKLAIHSTKSGRFQLWDLNGEKPELRLEQLEQPGIISLAFHPNGQQIALARGDLRVGTIEVYDVKTGGRLHAFQAMAPCTMAFHPTAPFLANDSYFANDVWVYDLRKEALAATYRPSGSMRVGGGLAWSPDGRTLTVPSGDGGSIYDFAFDPAAPGLKLSRTIEGPHMSGGAMIRYNPAGDRLVRRGWNAVVHLFDVVSGELLFATHGLLDVSVGGARVQFDRTGRRLAAARVGERHERVGLWSVADGREYRRLIDRTRVMPPRDDDQVAIAIHAGGRLAANRTALFDLKSGMKLAEIPNVGDRARLGSIKAAFDAKGNLLTNGYGGLFRWPVRPHPAAPQRLVIGPPEPLPFNRGDGPVAVSRDGRVVAQCMWAGYDMAPFAGGWFSHPHRPSPRRVDAGSSVGMCSVSPDGRWVAFGIHQDRMKVYDAESGECVWQAPTDTWAHCRFSADGRWLAVDIGGSQLFAVGTWAPGPKLGRHIVWDTTEDLAVMGQRDGVYRLVELATGRELARLEDPERNAGPAAFTPDGGMLVIAAPDGLRVWDLRLIRTELAKLGLDWDAPPLPPAKADDPAPLQVELDTADLAMTPGGETAYWKRQIALGSFRLALQPLDAQAALRRGRAYARLGNAAQAVDDFTLALALIPPPVSESLDGVPASEVAFDLNFWAWGWALKPSPESDGRKALFAAQKAVELGPTTWIYWNTLGVVQYRLGQYPQARESLDRSLQGNKGETGAFDLYFLAMCHHRLGHAAQARECYDQAVRWTESRQGKLPSNWAADLKSFRAEAAALLGM
jgi:serine/threonine protein kinase/WD40 repeat protein